MFLNSACQLKYFIFRISLFHLGIMPKMNASPPQKEDQVAIAHQGCKAECLAVFSI